MEQDKIIKILNLIFEQTQAEMLRKQASRIMIIEGLKEQQRKILDERIKIKIN